MGNHAYPDVAKTFFETAQIYVNNIIKNNGEEKYRKINKENKAFQNRICQAFGGVEFLHVLGYEEEDNNLFLKNYNVDELKKVSDLLERYKAYYWPKQIICLDLDILGLFIKNNKLSF